MATTDFETDSATCVNADCTASAPLSAAADGGAGAVCAAPRELQHANAPASAALTTFRRAFSHSVSRILASTQNVAYIRATMQTQLQVFTFRDGLLARLAHDLRLTLDRFELRL